MQTWIDKYELIYNDDPEDFEEMVNHYITLGFQPFGNPVIDSDKGFYQAMTRTIYVPGE
jgi:hypothetical protein